MSESTTHINRPAARPDADLACDFTIALEEVGIRDRLAPLVVRPARRIRDGVEVTFQPTAWDDVRRYIDVESRCCPFLSLAAEQTADGVVLRVTGRADAQVLIYETFGVRDERS